MPELKVVIGKGERRIPFAPGRSLRDILDEMDVRVRSGCRGMGACGLCRVRIGSGEVGEPTQNEQIHLGEAQLDQGVRLACQIMPERDIEIAILAPAPESNWRSLPDSAKRRMDRTPPSFPKDLALQVERAYGAAVDLGTTHINLSMYELETGQFLGDRYSLNPQMDFGSDVMTRLIAASESWEQAQALGQLVVKAIGEGLLDIATREGINLQQVVRLILVGNSAMLALLSGRNHGLLLQPRHWGHAIDCLPKNTMPWIASWGLHHRARIEVMPPLAGFVGSDLLAGVVTTCLTENGDGSLFIDFGTNSEIALWDGETLWVTSVAGGPAFEGSGISCGLPVSPGAVYRVNQQDGAFDYAVIGGSEPLGLCGSGIVDLIAILARSGELTDLGRFAPTVPKGGFALPGNERRMVLTKRDVDVFQRAKAAIGVGVQVLMAQAGVGNLRRIYVGGAFGRFLNIENAQDIGLLPSIQKNQVELCGNTALAGCVDMLLSPIMVERFKKLGNEAKVINLSQYPDFDDTFLENLYLKPMQGK